MSLLALGLTGLPCNAETGQTKRLVRAYAVKHSTRVPEPRSTAPSFIHATRDSLRFAPVSGTLAQCLSFITQFPSECISTKWLSVIRHSGRSVERKCLRLLKSKSAIVLVRHHPLPQLRNERLAVAAVTNGDHEFVGICRQLSCRICPLLAPFARWNLSPCTGIYRP